MVARGDLGVEIGDPELVGIQKALIRRARQLNRAVITATQMMESMIANPMHGRDQKGAVASLTSVAKLPFAYAKDGISYTFSIVPNALGKDDEVRKTNLAGLMDGYFHHEASIEGGQHLNVNVMNREMLLDSELNGDDSASDQLVLNKILGPSGCCL